MKKHLLAIAFACIAFNSSIIARNQDSRAVTRVKIQRELNSPVIDIGRVENLISTLPARDQQFYKGQLARVKKSGKRVKEVQAPARPTLNKEQKEQIYSDIQSTFDSLAQMDDYSDALDSALTDANTSMKKLGYSGKQLYTKEKIEWEIKDTQKRMRQAKISLFDVKPANAPALSEVLELNNYRRAEILDSIEKFVKAPKNIQGSLENDLVNRINAIVKKYNVKYTYQDIMQMVDAYTNAPELSIQDGTKKKMLQPSAPPFSQEELTSLEIEINQIIQYLAGLPERNIATQIRPALDRINYLAQGLGRDYTVQDVMREVEALQNLPKPSAPPLQKFTAAELEEHRKLIQSGTIPLYPKLETKKQFAQKKPACDAQTIQDRYAKMGTIVQNQESAAFNKAGKDLTQDEKSNYEQYARYLDSKLKDNLFADTPSFKEYVSRLAGLHRIRSKGFDTTQKDLTLDIPIEIEPRNATKSISRKQYFALMKQAFDAGVQLFLDEFYFIFSKGGNSAACFSPVKGDMPEGDAYYTNKIANITKKKTHSILSKKPATMMAKGHTEEEYEDKYSHFDSSLLQIYESLLILGRTFYQDWYPQSKYGRASQEPESDTIKKHIEDTLNLIRNMVKMSVPAFGAHHFGFNYKQLGSTVGGKKANFNNQLNDDQKRFYMNVDAGGLQDTILQNQTFINTLPHTNPTPRDAFIIKVFENLYTASK